MNCNSMNCNLTRDLKVLAILIFMTSYASSVQSQQVIKLYPGAAPGSESWNWTEKEFGSSGSRVLYNVSEPVLLHYPAPKDKANGTSVIVAPGGAFHILSIDNEGIRVAEWLSSLGVEAFVLKYRLVKSESDNPFASLMPLMNDMDKLDSINAPVVELAKNDGIEAMKYVRTNASRLGIDPAKIGFMGFSAGGTVTMSVAMSAEEEWKPDFVAPIYLYKNAVVGTDMPKREVPIFIAVATDDGLGFMPQSIALYQEWVAAGKPSELHAFEKGDHGFGFAPKGTTSDMWTQNFENWLRRRGLIP